MPPRDQPTTAADHTITSATSSSEFSKLSDFIGNPKPGVAAVQRFWVVVVELMRCVALNRCPPRIAVILTTTPLRSGLPAFCPCSSNSPLYLFPTRCCARTQYSHTVQTRKLTICALSRLSAALSRAKRTNRPRHPSGTSLRSPSFLRKRCASLPPSSLRILGPTSRVCRAPLDIFYRPSATTE